MVAVGVGGRGVATRGREPIKTTAADLRLSSNPSMGEVFKYEEVS